MASTQKGYPLQWFTEESKNSIRQKGLSCCQCLGVLRNAVQVKCGTRFCENCYCELFEDKPRGPVKCLLCEQDLTMEDVHYLSPDDYQSDNFCRNQVMRLTAHCTYKALGCEWRGTIEHFEEHTRGCPFARPGRCGGRKNCSYGHGRRRHKDAGCYEHIVYVCSEVRSLPADVKGSSSPKLPDSDQVDNDSSPMGPGSSTPIPDSQVNPEQVDPAHGPFELLLKMTNDNNCRISVLFGELAICSNKLLVWDNDSPSISDIDRLKQILAVFEKVTTDMQSKALTFERQLQDPIFCKTDGRLTWRIDNVRQLMEEACTGQSTAIYSPPFFTSEAGYKMCVRLYLNGDGIGRGSHLSLFFVLMKGHFDNILSWPFHRRITMLLVDQSGQGNHVREKFFTDPNSCSFTKPHSEMNIATGSPRFILKSELERRKLSYMNENTMFIKILVEDSFD